MTVRTCIDCRITFTARAPYAVRCWDCWKRWKDARTSRAEPRTVTVADPRLPSIDEWQDMLPRLLRLAHPDRHDGSSMATKATQWLLEQRRRLDEL